MRFTKVKATGLTRPQRCGEKRLVASGAHSELMWEGDGVRALPAPGSGLWDSGFQSRETREHSPATDRGPVRGSGSWQAGLHVTPKRQRRFMPLTLPTWDRVWRVLAAIEAPCISFELKNEHVDS